ncbi:DUF805 domain-containing protein [Enterococcus sp. LJL99]
MTTLVEFWKDMFRWNYTATRKQYWIPTIVYSILYNILFYSTGLTLTGISYLEIINMNPVVSLLGLALFIAQITLTARRLHDTNRSAAWILIGLLPVIGWIILVVMLCQPAKKEGTKEFSLLLNQSL